MKNRSASAELRDLTDAFADAVFVAVQRAIVAQVEVALGRSAPPREHRPAKRKALARPPTPPQPRETAAAPPRSETREATSTDDASMRVLELLRERPGILSEEARRALGLEKPTWLAAVAKLNLEGKLRKEGDKRATRYYLSAPTPEPFVAVPPVRRRRLVGE